MLAKLDIVDVLHLCKLFMLLDLLLSHASVLIVVEETFLIFLNLLYFFKTLKLLLNFKFVREELRSREPAIMSLVFS